MVDHYEPGVGRVDSTVETAGVEELLMKYPQLADGHADASGAVASTNLVLPTAPS